MQRIRSLFATISSLRVCLSKRRNSAIVTQLLMRPSLSTKLFVLLYIAALTAAIVLTTSSILAAFTSQEVTGDCRESAFVTYHISADDAVELKSLQPAEGAAAKQPPPSGVKAGGPKDAKRPAAAAAHRAPTKKRRPIAKPPGKAKRPIANHLEQYRLDIPTSTSGSAGQDHRMAAVCADLVCGEKFLQKFTPSDQPRIPAIRHILWKSEKVSKYFIQQLKSWQRIHPDWTFVLWRDSDLEPFVRKHFPGKIYQKYKSLPTTGPHGIKRVDMFRYMLMYKFGGVYADLDYTLVSSLDTYRLYPAVITREPEAHAAQLFGLSRWPLPVLANSAFFMSAPGHPFFHFALHQLVNRNSRLILEFAGPLGLSEMVRTYYQAQIYMVHPTEFVYFPPSYSFYSYRGNKLDTRGHNYMRMRIQMLHKACRDAAASRVPQVRRYCKNVMNLDPLTDRKQPLVAVHDQNKKESVYTNARGKEFVSDMQSAVLHIPNLKMGDAL